MNLPRQTQCHPLACPLQHSNSSSRRRKQQPLQALPVLPVNLKAALSLMLMLVMVTLMLAQKHLW